MCRPGFVLLLLGLLSACASTPKFDTTGVDASLTPAMAVSRDDTAVGRKVQWGGVIVATRNLRQRTQLEVLSYPLDRSGEPDTAGSPRGRFLLLQEGYLEPVDYAPGRNVTAVGSISEIELGKVGEAEYRYPVLHASQLHLWPKADPYQEPRPRSNVHFGIGVILR